MGTHNWMLVYAEGDPREALRRQPTLDRDATLKFAQRLFPGETLTPLDDVDLSDTRADDDELIVGCFPEVSIISASEVALDNPSMLAPRFIKAGGRGSVWVHCMHSVVDWFAYAQWTNGKLIRSLSLSPEFGIMEDIGPRLHFELPFWAGEHPATDGDEEDDDYPFPFHPLELAEAALATLFGYVLEGGPVVSQFDPQTIPLMRFQRTQPKPRPRWKFWS